MDPEQNDSAPEFAVPERLRRSPTSETAPSSDADNEEVVNLVGLLDEDEQKKMASAVIRGYDADVKSRSEHMRRAKAWYALYASVMRAKSFPWQDAANINLPIVAKAALQTAGRIWDMMYPANGHIFYSQPVGPDDAERAQATEIFGNHYLRWKTPEWGSGLRMTVFQAVLQGSAFRRCYWDEQESRVRSDWIPLDDFVVNYEQASNDPSMRDVRRYSLCQWMTIFDIEDAARDGIYDEQNAEKVKPSTQEARKEGERLRDIVDKAEGTSPSTDESADDQIRLVIEQHRTWRFPKDPERGYPFDGRGHPAVITVDDISKQVLRVVLREQDEPGDLSRFQQQEVELAAFQSQMEAYMQAVEAMQAQAQGAAVAAAQNPGMPAPPPPQLPPPPQPPAWYREGEEIRPPRKIETTFFIHYKMFPSEGFYGLGIGDFIGQLNQGANAIINGHLDGVALKNARPGFIDRTTKMQRGAISVRPGEIQEVDAVGGDISKLVHFLEVPESDRTTLGLVQMFMGTGDQMSGTSDIASGEGTGANRTAKEASILNENAQKQVSVAERGLAEALKVELFEFWRRWGVFLPEEELYDVLDLQQQPRQIKISRDMFLLDAHVVPACDPRTQVERSEQAQGLYAFCSSNPLIAQNQAAMTKVTETVLRALSASELIPLIQPPPPPAPPPARRHWEEDADFIRDKDSPVNPDDDDDEHIAGHEAFEATPAAQRLTKVGRDMIERHVRAHYAQRLEKVSQQLQQGANNDGPAAPSPMGGPPGGGPGPVAPPPGNGGVPGIPQAA